LIIENPTPCRLAKYDKMAEKIIKPLALKNFKPAEKEQNIKDGGNLYVRIRSIADGGAVSYRYYYRFEGKQYWLTIPIKEQPKETSDLVKARKERDRYQDMLKKGINPALEVKLEAERNTQQQLAEQRHLAQLAARQDVAQLFNHWRDTDLINRKDQADVCRMFHKDVLPLLGPLLVEDIRKSHITQITDTIKRRGAAHTARNLLKLIRQMFRFAVDRDIIEFDPTASLSITQATTKPTERDRVLSTKEIRLLARQLPDARLLPSTECTIWIMLATLCRVGEISQAQWQHIDFQERLWTIPVANAKNKKLHKIHLSDFALAQFIKLQAVATSDVWLLPNRNDSGPVCLKSIAKQIDGRQTDTLHQGRCKNSQALILPDGKWTAHDLRRTGATLMGELGIDSDVVERCANHAEQNKMKRVYQQQTRWQDQQQAWTALGGRLNLLANADDNVVPFKQTA